MLLRSLSVGPGDESGHIPLALDNGENVEASPQMTARYLPLVGDYWVVQSDGYTYLNPRDVFLRKYSTAPDEEQTYKATEQAA